MKKAQNPQHNPKKKRLQSLQTSLQSSECYLITSFENYRYFSGFSGSNCALIITSTDALLLTDGRYTEQAKIEAPESEIILQKGSLNALICEILTEKNIRTVNYETEKLSDFTVSFLKAKTSDICWLPVPSFATDLRAVKDEDELSCIRRAVEISDKAFLKLLPEIEIGMSEREVAARLEYYMAILGSEHPAFETISASGVRSSLPHGAPTDKKICENELLTLDFGACFNGYMSDITRTIMIGAPCDKLVNIFDTVLAVQEACVNAVKPGILAKELDLLQRKLFEEAGFSEYICHSLGHGVGLEIHEAPTVSKLGETILKPGMVITIEPGLYIPNLGGVRTEDTVLVTESGFERLTKSPRNVKL